MSLPCQFAEPLAADAIPSFAGGFPPIATIGRERLWLRRVGPVRNLRRSKEEIAMATSNPKKPALHGAAASAQGKAEAAKDQAKPANAKPKDTGRMPFNAGNKSDSANKSR
jgi:hypothetical protein